MWHGCRDAELSLPVAESYSENATQKPAPRNPPPPLIFHPTPPLLLLPPPSDTHMCNAFEDSARGHAHMQPAQCSLRLGPHGGGVGDTHVIFNTIICFSNSLAFPFHIGCTLCCNKIRENPLDTQACGAISPRTLRRLGKDDNAEWDSNPLWFGQGCRT